MEKKTNELMISERFFKEPIGNKNKYIYTPKRLKQVGRDNIKLDNKQLKNN